MKNTEHSVDGVTFKAFHQAGGIFSFDPDNEMGIPVDEIFGFDRIDEGDDYGTLFELNANNSGYGAATIICVPEEHKAIVRAKLDDIYKILTSSAEYGQTGGLRAATLTENGKFWVFINDGTASYRNFGELLADIPSLDFNPEKEDVESLYVYERTFIDPTRKFILLSGDENTDSGFEDWLNEEYSEMHFEFVANKWMKDTITDGDNA